MKKVEDVMGVDVSKNTLDAYIHNLGSHVVFTNDKLGFKSLTQRVKE